MRRKITLACCTIVLAVSGCASQSGPRLEGMWVLRFAEVDGERKPLTGAARFRLSFLAGTVTGGDGCHELTGKYEAVGAWLRFDQCKWTTKDCRGEFYVPSLPGEMRYGFDRGSLVLTTDQVTYRFD